MKKHLSAAFAAATCLMTPAFAAKIVTFEGLGPNGTVIDANDPALAGITSIGVVSGGSVQNTLITFDTNLSNTADPDLEAPFDDPNTAVNEMETGLGFIAIIPTNTDFSNPNDEGAGGTITINFDRKTFITSIDVVDSQSGSITFFDGTDVIDTVTIPNVDTSDTVLPNQFTTLTFNLMTGATSMEIVFGESGGFDNLAFSQVPVPAAFPLFAAGLGGLVAARRKKAA
ncbi:MAG: VPLPA-CTERM sorting domain-containing protein [Pseudomonadota bacterium]